MINFVFVPCAGLSWLHVIFLLHVKYSVVSHHIVYFSSFNNKFNMPHFHLRSTVWTVCFYPKGQEIWAFILTLRNSELRHQILMCTYTFQPQIIVCDSTIKNSFAVEKYTIIYIFKVTKNMYVILCQSVHLIGMLNRGREGIWQLSTDRKSCIEWCHFYDLDWPWRSFLWLQIANYSKSNTSYSWASCCFSNNIVAI